MKAHVAYAALNLAVRRLEELEIEKDDQRAKAKRLLQKCAYSMLSHQELSGPQVASYLLGQGDHYTSHDYAYLYWTSVEHHVDTLDPSPECYPIENRVLSDPAAEDESDNPPDPDAVRFVPSVHPSAQESEEVEGTDIQRQLDEDGFDLGEVVVDVDSQGNLSMQGDLVADYSHRGDLFRQLTLWDFVGRVQKMYKSKQTMHDEERDESDEADGAGETVHVDMGTGATTLLSDTKHSRPRCELTYLHPQHKTHELCLKHPRKRRVPVPVGPPFPRRDQLSKVLPIDVDFV